MASGDLRRSKSQFCVGLVADAVTGWQCNSLQISCGQITSGDPRATARPTDLVSVSSNGFRRRRACERRLVIPAPAQAKEHGEKIR